MEKGTARGNDPFPAYLRGIETLVPQRGKNHIYGFQPTYEGLKHINSEGGDVFAGVSSLPTRD